MLETKSSNLERTSCFWSAFIKDTGLEGRPMGSFGYQPNSSILNVMDNILSCLLQTVTDTLMSKTCSWTAPCFFKQPCTEYSQVSLSDQIFEHTSRAHATSPFPFPFCKAKGTRLVYMMRVTSAPTRSRDRHLTFPLPRPRRTARNLARNRLTIRTSGGYRGVTQEGRCGSAAECSLSFCSRSWPKQRLLGIARV